MDVQKSIFLKSASLVTGLTKIWAGVNDTVTELATAGASLPSGLIAIWKGSTSTIPDGWVLCDGQNGTPDLRDKFVLGTGNLYAVGSTGGERTHTLTVSEMPSHNHSSSESSIRIPLNDRSGGSGAIFGEKARYSANGIDIDVSVNIGYTGGGSAHNNMPPYYVLCYIMKT